MKIETKLSNFCLFWWYLCCFLRLRIQEKIHLLLCIVLWRYLGVLGRIYLEQTRPRCSLCTSVVVRLVGYNQCSKNTRELIGKDKQWNWLLQERISLLEWFCNLLAFLGRWRRPAEQWRRQRNKILKWVGLREEWIYSHEVLCGTKFRFESDQADYLSK